MLTSTRKVAIGLVFVATTSILLWAPTGAVAQDDPGPNQGKISASAGFDITNAYFFRGIVQEDQGFIIQPWVDISLNLSDNFDFNFGIWNSFHDVKTAAANTGNEPDTWYEADLYFGLTYTGLENTELGISYTALTSPNNGFPTIREVGFSAAYDDSALWEDTAIASGLQPSMKLVFELDGQADLGSNEGIYLELAIEPSFAIIESEDFPVTLSIPVTVGLSLGDYYEDPSSPGGDDDSNFGYLDIGAVFSMPLTCIPADYGQWEMSVGLHYLYLSESTEALNQDTNGDEIIATFGISMGY